jgi:hypothetical protein
MAKTTLRGRSHPLVEVIPFLGKFLLLLSRGDFQSATSDGISEISEIFKNPPSFPGRSLPPWSSKVVESLWSILESLTSFEPNKQLLLGLTMLALSKAKEKERGEEEGKEKEGGKVKDEGKENGEGGKGKEKEKEKEKEHKEGNGVEAKREEKEAEMEVEEPEKKETEGEKESEKEKPEGDNGEFFSVIPVLLAALDFTHHSLFDPFLRPYIPSWSSPPFTLRLRPSPSHRPSSTPWSPSVVVPAAFQVLINLTVDCSPVLIDFLCTRSIFISRVMHFVLDERHWKCGRHQEWREEGGRENRGKKRRRRRGEEGESEFKEEGVEGKRKGEREGEESNDDRDEESRGGGTEEDERDKVLSRKALSLFYNVMVFPSLVQDHLSPFLLRLIEKSVEVEGGEQGKGRCRRCQGHKRHVVAMLQVLLGV